MVALLLVLALGLRVGQVQRSAYRAVNDAGSYNSLASDVANTGDYDTPTGPAPGAGNTRGPSAYFPPGFPYFLAAVDLIDGHTGGGRPALHPARLSQAVLGTVAVALVGLVALEAFGPTVGVISLALAAVYPVLIELSGALVAENLLLVLELAALWAVLRARRSEHRYRWVAGAGVLTGLATLAHENGILLLIPLAIGLWTARPRFSPRALAAPALLIGVALLTIAPWTIRNAAELHRLIPVSDETGITLIGTYNPASAAFKPVPYKWRLFSSIPGERHRLGDRSRLSEPQLGDRLLSQAEHYIGDHPLVPLSVALHNTLRMLELEGSYAWHASAKAMSLQHSDAEIGVFSFWVLCLLALAGLFTKLVRRAPVWMWGIPLLLALSVVLVNMETPRFREPVDPFLIMLVGCALATALAPGGRLLAPGGRLRRNRLGGTPVGGGRETPGAARQAELIEVVERLA